MYNRYRGSWLVFGRFYEWPAVAWQIAIMKDIGHPFMLKDLKTGETVEEWFPPEYDRNPATNHREAQPECDILKRRFPGVRRRAAR